MCTASRGPSRREALLDAVAHGSTVAWRHLNLETGKNRGLDWVASASVPKVGCQLDSVWGEHSRPRSASPPSQPPVFPGLVVQVPAPERHLPDEWADPASIQLWLKASKRREREIPRGLKAAADAGGEK